MSRLLITIILVVLFSSLASAALTDDLMSYYEFQADFTDSNRDNDFSASGAPTFDTGRVGQGLDFDNSDDYIVNDLDNRSDFTHSNDFTICYWLNTTSVARDGLATTAKNDLSTSGGWISELRSGGDAGKIRYELDSTVKTSVLTNEVFNEGVWTYHCAALNGTNLMFYKNGTNFQNETVTAGYAPPEYGLMFGGLRDTNTTIIAGDFEYDGFMDELGYWGRALTGSEISQLYNNGAGLAFNEFTITNFEVTARINDYNDAILVFNATINGTFYSTTNGTINTNIVSTADVINISSDSDGYFGQNFTHNVSQDSTLVIDFIQSQINFNAVEKITNNSIVNFTINDSSISISDVNGTATVHLQNGSTILEVFNNISYYNYTFTRTTTNLENTSQEVVLFNHKLNVTLTNSISNTQVSGITLIATHGSFVESVNVTGDTAILNLTQGLEYNLSYNGTGLAANSSTYTASGLAIQFNFTSLPELSFSLTFRDEEDDTLIDDDNIELDIIGAINFTNQSTSNGTIFIQGLTEGEYQLRYKGSQYPLRKYFANATSGSFNSITLYLLNQTAATNVSINVIDEKGDDVVGATVQLLRYYLSTNSYRIVEMTRTNFNGEGSFQVQLNDEDYRFIILINNNSVLTTDGSPVTNTNIQFQVNLGTLAASEEFIASQNINYNLTFLNATDQFEFTFVHDTGTDVEACLLVQQIILNADNIVIADSCLTAGSGSIFVNITRANRTTFEATASVLFDDQTEPTVLQKLSQSFGFGQEVLGLIGVFLLSLVVIAVALIFSWNANVAIITSMFLLIVARLIGLLNINVLALTGLIGVGFIVMYMNRS